MAPASGETAGDLLKALRALEAAGRLRIEVEAAKLNHIDSPVVVEADSNIWIYAFILAALLAWWRWGALAGLEIAAAGLVVYLTLGRRYVLRRIERRVREKALYDLDTWRRLWRFGGITLVSPDRPGLAECRAPEGNWMSFVRTLAAPR